jgi:hypothetical protein
MMGKGAKAGVTLFWAGALIAVLGAPAFAQGKQLSDKSVQTLMRYAWGMVPEKFTTPTGKVIVVDKSHTSDSVVPVDVAREAIRVAYISANAQLCELIEEQRANFQTFMLRAEADGKYSDQQMLFINQLHLFTVMWLTGKVQLVEKDGDKQVVVQESKPLRTESCSDTERKKVQEQVMAYVNSAPPPAAVAGTPAPPAKRAEPMPASQSK